MSGVERKYVKIGETFLGIDFANFLFEATEAVLSSYGVDKSPILNKIADSLTEVYTSGDREISVHKWESGNGGYIESEYMDGKRRIYFELKQGKLYMKKKPEEKPDYGPDFLEKLRMTEYKLIEKDGKYKPHFELDKGRHNKTLFIDERLLGIDRCDYGGTNRPSTLIDKKHLIN